MNYFKHILSILFCVLTFNVQAQETPAQIGNRLFNLNRFADAIPFYQQELETLKDPNLFQDVTFRLAECYRILGKNEEAEKAYKIMFLKNRKSPGVLYNYAIFLKGLGKYSDAKQKFVNYATMFQEDTLVKWQIASCDSAIAWIKYSTGYYVREIKDVNSPEPEFSPLLLNNTLHFVSSKVSAAELTGQSAEGDDEGGNVRKATTTKGKKVQPDKNALDAPLPTLDIFTTLVSDTTIKLAAPKLMTGFGESLHEGPSAVNAKGDEIFITRPSETGVRDRSKNLVENRLIIVSSKKEASGQWSALKEDLSFNKPEEYSVGHPAISPDGRFLVFMSDKPGGFGGTDLYLSIRNGETWGESVNLGPQINTAGYEMFPYFRDDGTFYFSSNMHPGMGGLDIFSIKYDSASSAWGKVTNMRPPVNSSYDDFGITFVKGSDKGFFSSKRPEGTGDDDIYSFIGNKEIQVTYDGDEFRIRNEFFYDQLTYVVKDLETGKESLVAGNTPEIKLKLSPNKKYELKSMRGKQIVNTLALSYGLSPEGAFNLAFSSDSLPVNIKGYIRSSDASGTAQSILNAAKGSVGVPGVEIKINNSKNELVQETVTDSSGKFNFRKTFSPKENYGLALSDQKPVSFNGPVTTSKETVTDKPDSLISFKGRAVRLGTAAPVTGVKISLFKGTQEITKVTNDKDGRILFNLNRGETYTVVGSKDGFFQCQVKVSTINKPNISAIEEVLAMEPIKRDTSINLIDIYYDFAKATLRSESKKVLMRMYQFLKDNDSIAIELMAHTDEVGTDASNMVLSQKRAQSVVDFLIEKGVSPQRMLAVGYGESTPKVPNAHNAKDHQLNRRTEFRIVGKSDIPKLLAVHKRKIAEYESTFRKEQEIEALKPAEKSLFTVSPNMGSGNIDGIVQAKPEQGIVYKVQIASSETEVPPDYFSGFKRVETLRDAKGIHKYFGASTTSYDEALVMLNKIRSENKIGDAFVVPYKDGKRIEFDEIEGWGTKRFTVPAVPSQPSHYTANEQVNGYVVQIAALRTKDKLPDFKGVDVKEKKGEDGFYRYYVGPFASMEQANAERQRLISLGFSGAFIKSGL
jgi:outer membrane protein OmpA-like peptidoglycan-associated protein